MKTDAQLTPVREAHRFDKNALDEYLKNNLILVQIVYLWYNHKRVNYFLRKR